VPKYALRLLPHFLLGLWFEGVATVLKARCRGRCQGDVSKHAHHNPSLNGNTSLQFFFQTLHSKKENFSISTYFALQFGFEESSLWESVANGVGV